MGLIAVGTTATLIGKVIAAKANFAAFAEEMPGVAAGLGVVGTAAAALAVGHVVGGFLDHILLPEKRANLGKLEKSLLSFGQTGKATGELAKITGSDVDKLSTSVEHLAAPSVLNNVSNHIFGVVGVMTGVTTTSERLKHKIDDLDQGLATLAGQSPQAAAAALEKLRSKMSDKDYDRLLKLLPQYQSALAQDEVAAKSAGHAEDILAVATGVASDAASTAGDDFVRLAGITGKNIDPIKELTGAVDGLVSKFLSVEGFSDTFQHDLNGLAQSVKDAREGHLLLGDALTSTSDTAITFRGNLRGIVEDGAKVIDTLVQQGASSDQVKAKIAALSASFEAQAKAAGVPQPVIDHYLAVLNSVPSLVSTTVQVTGADGAIEKLGKLNAAFATVPRYVATNFVGPLVKGQERLPGHASGGRDQGPTWVGEGGREVFVPDRPGYIVNHSDAVRVVADASRFKASAVGRPSPPTGGDLVIQFSPVVHVAPGAAATGHQLMAEMFTALQKEIRGRGGLEKAFAQ